MRVAVLGGRGMLGAELVRALERAGRDAAALDLPEADITREEGLEDLPACEGVVNCAAYTDVDGAEREPAKAFAVNMEGAGRVARWCAERGVRLIHLSTDYVFDGRLGRPYREEDRPNPQGVYARSKLAGELAVTEAGGDSLIVRTQGLFGPRGRNFVAAILARLRAGEVLLEVVGDQTNCPTYTGHLADAILRLLGRPATGIVHVSASGRCTWFEFARAILARAGSGAELRPISTARSGRPAPRPAFSALAKGRYEELTGCRMPSWQEGLDAYFEAMGGRGMGGRVGT